MQPVIRVENLSKRYKLGLTHAGSVRELVNGAFARLAGGQRGSARNDRESADHVWALRDVSFEVNPGEVLGIIGRNGAGKSTLLKILSRITTPTAGRVEMRGRVASLLEVGTGFHPELTGRENVYMNGTVLGMTRREIDREFDSIVDFAGVEAFIDTPVKRYSSGMTVRLGFAVAAHMSPEILIVDEVLAVGDAEFQKRCIGKMGEVARTGRTILFVSHNLPQISRLTDRSLLIDAGKSVCEGSTREVIESYLLRGSAHSKLDRQNQFKFFSNREVKLNGVQISSESSVSGPKTGEPCCITAEMEFLSPAKNVGIIFSIRTIEGTELLRISTIPISGHLTGTCKGLMRCHLKIEELLLAGGEYSLWMGVSIPNIEFVMPITELGSFTVEPEDFYKTGTPVQNTQSPLLTRHHWIIEAAT